jgi:hypothetical protein
LPPLGPSLYCFIVYSRSDVFKSTTGELDGEVRP